MKGSFRLVRLAGVPVEIHWTFGLLILWVVYVLLRSNIGIVQSLTVLAVLSAVFGSVILHEYGHALMARTFGVRTRDIILTPIGGVARLEHIPEQPLREMLIALAGPAVNLCIGSLLLAYAAVFTNYWIDLLSPQFWMFNYAQPALIIVAKINFLLLLFNLVPAFPMDGGRVLRAMLSFVMTRTNATVFAARAGQVIGLFLVLTFLFEIISGNPVVIVGFRVSDVFLALIGSFVFIAAGRELKGQKLRDQLQSTPLKDITNENCTTVQPDTPVSELVSFDDENYMVVSEGEVIGILFHEDIPSSVQQGVRASDLMRDSFEVLDAGISAWEALVVFRDKGYMLCPVKDGSKVIGMVTRENIRAQTSIPMAPGSAGSQRATARQV